MIIYLIRNTVNGKVYVGKTERTLQERWAEHVYDAKANPRVAPLLYRAINKYGPESFSVSTIDHASSRRELDVTERLWIWFYQSANSARGYNLTLGGTGGKPNAATLEKLRRPKTEEHKRHCSEAAKRRVDLLGPRSTAHMNTDEARQKKSAGLKGRKFSEETLLKMSESAKRRAESKEGRDRLAAARVARSALQRDAATGQYVASATGGC